MEAAKRLPGDVDVEPLQSFEDSEQESEKLELREHRGFLSWLLMAVRRRNGALAAKNDFERVSLLDEKREKIQRSTWKSPGRRSVSRIVLSLFLLLFIALIVARITDISAILMDQDSLPKLPLEQYASGDFTGLTTNVTPKPCHSHNDYWRRIPLYEALHVGCTGVEADIWLTAAPEDLLVGHSKRELQASRTLRSMYLDPLEKMLDERNTNSSTSSPSSPKNGVFESTPAQTLVLMIDFKEDGHETYPLVWAHLTSLRAKGYLSTFDGEELTTGALTIVATGNAPFDLIANASLPRDIFFDAPLGALAASSPPLRTHGQGTVGTSPTSHFDATNSFYASVDFKKAVGWCWFGRLTDAQRETIRRQIGAAKERGLQSRYWGGPGWPRSVRDHVWRVLVEEKVGFLNGDDLKAMVGIME